MKRKALHLTLDPREIASIVDRVGDQMIEHDFDPDAVAIPILTGAMFFAADLLRYVEWSGYICPAIVSSYLDAQEPSHMPHVKAFTAGHDYKGKQVCIIDDILDTGATMETMIALCDSNMKPSEITVATLFDRGKTKLDPKIKRFNGRYLPEGLFAVGYGLDLAGRDRANPEVNFLTTDWPRMSESNNKDVS